MAQPGIVPIERCVRALERMGEVYGFPFSDGPGDFFGETAMLDGRSRTASVVADGPVHCLVLARSDFRQFLDGDSSIAWNMLAGLAARLRPD